MKKLSHTPGPWKVYKGAIHPSLDWPATANANGGYIICDEFCGPDAQFNRRLVAAAPKLETFRSLVANLQPYKFPKDESWTDDQAEDAIVTLNRLIGEARKLHTKVEA